MAGFKMTWHGAQAKAAMRRGTDRGLRMAGEHLLAESQREVPKAEGTLERSGRVVIGDRTVALTYDTPYARVQHERTDYRHTGGRKAKYVEDPMRREAQVCLALIAEGTGGEIGGGAGWRGGRRRR